MKYKVEVEHYGYVRGYQMWSVEADSAQEAKDTFQDGQIISDDIVRDDREYGEAYIRESK